MVHRLVVSYGQPEDPAAFDDYYRGTHAPLVLARPGLVRFTSGHTRPLDPGQSGPYLVADLDLDLDLDFDSESMSSPEGRAAGKDIADFATGGATFVHVDVQRAS